MRGVDLQSAPDQTVGVTKTNRVREEESDKVEQGLEVGEGEGWEEWEGVERQRTISNSLMFDILPTYIHFLQRIYLFINEDSRCGIVGVTS